MWGVEICVIAGMIAVNGLFAGYEIALASASLARLRVLAQQERAGAKAALFMKQRIEGSLAAIQIGVTLAGAIAAATGGAGAKEDVAPLLESSLGLSSGTAELLAVTAVVLPITALSILFGELLPKVVALRNTEWLCLTLSPAMRWFTAAAYPAVWLFERALAGIMRSGGGGLWSEGERRSPEDSAIAELRASAELARALRLIGRREEEIILAAAALRTRPVREIMLPAEHIGMLSAKDSLAEALITAHLDMHTRFPVTEREGDPQGIIGYVNVKDLVAQMRLAPHDSSLAGIMRPIPSLPSTQPISSCLETLMRSRGHIALVRDASGNVRGMITLEDIVEELIGDIEDEYDRLPATLVAAGQGWVIGGGATLARIREATGVDLVRLAPEGSALRLAEWVSGHLGREPRGGEIVERDGVRVVVRKIRRQKVQEAYLSRTGPGTGA
jgi:putative hemolysin